MKYTLAGLFCLLASTLLLAQQPILPRRLVVLQPTEEKHDSLPDMRVVPDTALLARQTAQLVNSTFIGPILDVYFLAQQKRINDHLQDSLEPAYLALTHHQGGFAKTGFNRLDASGATRLPASSYVDVMENVVGSPAGKLASVTQLYPHELGHIFYRMLSGGEDRGELGRNSNIHFYKTTTEYGVAFNEGFAEHIENLARRYEPDATVLQGIQGDIDKKTTRLAPFPAGFVSDYQFPWRIPFYRGTLLAWYAQWEDLQRAQAQGHDLIRFKNGVLPLADPEARLHFRNTGVRVQEGALRPPAQFFATEGCIATFLTRLNTSGLQQNYLPDTLYRQFLPPGVQSSATSLSPWQNQLLKNALVLQRFVHMKDIERSPFFDFIHGYLQQFPAEADSVRQFFQETAGYPLPDSLPPQLWMMVKGFEHRVLVLDAYGAATIPVYTFDLNAAEVEDLLTLPGMTEAAARELLTRRDATGGFQSWEQAEAGAPAAIRDLLSQHHFDQAYFDSIEDPEFSVTALLLSPLYRVFGVAMGWFVALFALFYVFFGKNHTRPVRWAAWLLGGWLLFVIAGLAVTVMFGGNLLYFTGIIVITALPGVYRHRNNPARLREHLLVTLVMGLVVAVSLWHG